MSLRGLAIEKAAFSTLLHCRFPTPGRMQNRTITKTR